MPQPVTLKKLKLNGSVRPTRPYRTNTKKKEKRCPFHYRGLECKSRNSRDIWSNRQIWPWSTKWSRAKANRVLPRECTGHSKHPLPVLEWIAISFSRGSSRPRNRTQVSRTAGRCFTIWATREAQYKRRHYICISPDGQYWNKIDYILCSQRWRSSIHSKNKTRSWLWLRSWTLYCQIQTYIEESRENH